ncbi:hypothetical protein Hbl1158_10785 [Halobaculum sp. CBA1158]|uniref:hypothetical protein n=1 Tax=Halobaculum sp. CBA1158 TaxID=2904243 RepID=UPI001F2790B5|nr:hypothetical protein [Halobaculum sp. CBA1158]UIO99017.1 hypothetical protein Hbl1158_10785 [Halobaculum sp. CBA1158]
MNRDSAETLLAELLERGSVPEERVEAVERLKRQGRVWHALEYAMKGKVARRWSDDPKQRTN